jgi:hypothetical protein
MYEGTTPIKMVNGTHVMKGGVVCAPGFGSGVYNVEVAGRREVVGVRIQFLSPSDEALS